jgi:tyrosyl-tRNA synthetase
MSQSLGNYVGITEPPDEMFGKLMRIPDELIGRYMLLCTEVGPDEIARMEAGLADGSLKPVEQKRRMAREIVDLYQGSGVGDQAEARFDLVHKEREIPDDVPDAAIPPGALRNGKVWLPKLMAELGLASSNSEARRLIEQGGVRLDGEPLTDPDAELDPGALARRVLQVGRRKFVRLKGS